MEREFDAYKICKHRILFFILGDREGELKVVYWPMPRPQSEFLGPPLFIRFTVLSAIDINFKAAAK